MPWEQLALKELGGRVMLIAGYLHGKVGQDDVLLDLDCGMAPLREYVVCNYIGNDTYPPFVEHIKSKPGTWLECADDSLPEFERVDILCCLGYGARYHPLESDVVDGVICELAKKHRPRVIVLETWVGVAALPRCGFDDTVSYLVDRGYRVDYDWTIEDNNATTQYSKRRVVALGV